MIRGHGSDFTVAMRIAEDHRKGIITRLSLRQAIEKVVIRGESLIGRDEDVSYIWFQIINDGEPTIKADFGRHRQYGVIVEEYEQDGTRLFDIGDDLTYFMLTRGISYGQSILMRWRGQWRDTGSYYESDWDLEVEREIIYAHVIGGIDIPFTIENPFQSYTTKISYVD